ncbi:MAG TPA: VanW family protein [Caulobacteraceae bacterium]|jgi:hypothetical protein|nr:VanW family protein [Caulobacteraceae bacterium]
MTSIIAPAAYRRPRRPHPTRASQALFEAKATAFRLRRSLTEFGRTPPKLARTQARAAYATPVASSVTPLWADPNLSEQAMQLGKVQNLRRAAAHLDGLVLAPGKVFSFWRHIGRATAARGFANGRMLREGCMMPAVGGGLCQLSNALYDVALQSGCRIDERHAHSFHVPGSAADEGRDATVAWNYVDLRFASKIELMLSVNLTARELIVSLRAVAPEPADAAAPDAAAPGGAIAAPGEPEVESCAVCDEADCAFHEGGASPGRTPAGRAAYIVDEWWPEFADHVAAERTAADVLLTPVLRRWSAAGFGAAHQSRIPAAMRSLGWRITPPQGAARRSADAATTAAIAKALSRRLALDVTELTVAQSLLAQLWREGALGGRRIRVLMTRLPVLALQQRLDAFAEAHPERGTLADYRAEPWLAEAETEALAAADEILTPHAEIASLFGARARLLDWRRPAAPTRAPTPGDVFAFPGPTVARKGAYELREAARRLGATVRPLGAALEGRDFWAGVALDPATAGGGWLDGVRAVVHPALAEAAPRRLLEALAAGVPVIATAACGLAPQPGLTLVPMDDVEALAAAMAAA